MLRHPHGCACDVWGMGTLHFELLAGKQMFRKVRLFSEMEALLENAAALVEHMARPPRMSELAQDLMLRMLQVGRKMACWLLTCYNIPGSSRGDFNTQNAGRFTLRFCRRLCIGISRKQKNSPTSEPRHTGRNRQRHGGGDAEA